MDQTQNNELVKIWADVFSRYPKGVLANPKKLDEQIEKFGIAFGKIKTEIIRHKLGGMNIAATAMKTKLDKLEQDFDGKIYEYLGYPVIDDYVKTLLKEKATKQFKHFNEYYYTSYPRPIPPVVLEGIQIAKQYFPPSNIKVWAIEDEPLLKDPVVIAEVILPGKTTPTAYLIGIWDNDIELSDVIDTAQFFAQPKPEEVATQKLAPELQHHVKMEKSKTKGQVS